MQFAKCSLASVYVAHFQSYSQTQIQQTFVIL